MASNNQTSRIQSNLGIRTGFKDNSGVSISQEYFGVTATSGTVSITPNADFTYVNLTNALTGNVAISINGTYSNICDELTVYMTGGASAYVITYDSAISALTGTFSATANKSIVYKGSFNGSKYIGHQSIQS